MALTKQQKLTFQNTKKQIRLISREIELKAISKINKAITCGALSEDSDFLDENTLLARTILEDVMLDHTIKFKGYRDEADNLMMMI
jgi:hypothetical protein